VVTVSEFSRKELSDVYGLAPGKILVVPNAASSAFGGEPSLERSEFVLAVGSQAIHKNVHGLLEAWPAVRSRAPSATLRLVGTRLDVGTRDDGRRGSVPDGVEFLGRVSDVDLAALYRTAAVYVLPSLYEGFGLPILEAQACGCPVVAANVASIPEVLNGSGILFDPRDPASIAQAVGDVLCDADLRRDFSERGRANVGRYSWEESAQTLNTAVDELVAA